MIGKALPFLEDLGEWLHGRWSQISVPLLVGVVSAFLVQNPFSQNVPNLKIGEVAKSDLKAPTSLLVVDEELTRHSQLIAEQRVQSVFDFDSQRLRSLSSQITSSFERARQATDTITKEEFEDLLGTTLKSNEWNSIVGYRFDRRIQQALEQMIASVYSKYLLSDFPRNWSDIRQISLRDLVTEEERFASKAELEENVLTIDQALANLDEGETNLSELVRSVGLERFRLARLLAKKLITPNFSFNQIETIDRQNEARGQVERSVVEIAKGEMIIREGQRVDRSHVMIIEGLRSKLQASTDFRSFIGLVSLLVCLIYLFYWIGSRNFRRFRLNTRDRVTLGGFFIFSIGLIAILEALFEAAQTQSLSGLTFIVLLPFAFGGMTLRLIASIEITFFFNLLLSVCCAWLLKDPFMALTCLSVSMAGAAAMRHISQRLDVFKAGLIAGMVQAIIICLGVIMNLTSSVGLDNAWLDLFATAGLALCSGLLSAGVVLSVQPILEFLGYTTDLRLMELSNTNHPLLRELIMKAPGTYFHSFTVSQLSEKAAEKINANPLFARVASLYHDVGKLKKPQYFIENVKGENRHDKLVPSMSALIISNHVKEGIELAHDHKLPQAIVDCIPQHHGTSLISYFYEKAKKAAVNEEEVDDRDFRYPGPKPQTKEAAIIMLADAVEATAKSLQNAPSDVLRQKVNQTIRRFFLDGQLDECDLSLKDLNAIGNAFVQVLQGIYHQRIDYPHLKDASAKPEEVNDPIKRQASDA